MSDNILYGVFRKNLTDAEGSKTDKNISFYHGVLVQMTLWKILGDFNTSKKS